MTLLISSSVNGFRRVIVLLVNHPWNILEEVMSFLFILSAFFFEKLLKMRGFQLFYQSCAFKNNLFCWGDLGNVVSREVGSKFLVEESCIFVSRCKLEIAWLEPQIFFLFSKCSDGADLVFLLHMNFFSGYVLSLQAHLEIQQLLCALFSLGSGRDCELFYPLVQGCFGGFYLFLPNIAGWSNNMDGSCLIQCIQKPFPGYP